MTDFTIDRLTTHQCKLPRGWTVWRQKLRGGDRTQCTECGRDFYLMCTEDGWSWNPVIMYTNDAGEAVTDPLYREYVKYHGES